MPISKVLMIIALASLLAMLISACVERQEDGPGGADRTVPTPVPTEPEGTDVDPTPEPTPEPTLTEDAEPTMEPGDAGDLYELVISEKTYPEAEIGEQILELAETPEEFGELWNWFEFDPTGPVPELDWDGRVMLFAGTGESSGCPLVIDDVIFDEEERFIGVEMKQDVPEDTMCTMDWTPRVFVLSLDAERLGDGELRAAIYDTEYVDDYDPEDGVVIREAA